MLAKFRSEYPFNLMIDIASRNDLRFDLFDYKLIEKQINILSPENKQILELRYRDKISLKDISTQLNMTESKYAHALDNVKKELKQKVNYARTLSRKDYATVINKHNRVVDENEFLRHVITKMKNGNLKPETLEINEITHFIDMANVTIEDLGLSSTAYNGLFRHNIKNLKDLIEIPHGHLITLRGIGVKSVSEIENILDQYSDEVSSIRGLKNTTIQELNHMLEIKDNERPSYPKEYNYSDITSILLEGKRHKLKTKTFF